MRILEKKMQIFLFFKENSILPIGSNLVKYNLGKFGQLITSSEFYPD